MENNKLTLEEKEKFIDYIINNFNSIEWTEIDLGENYLFHKSANVKGFHLKCWSHADYSTEIGYNQFLLIEDEESGWSDRITENDNTSNLYNLICLMLGKDLKYVSQHNIKSFSDKLKDVLDDDIKKTSDDSDNDSQPNKPKYKKI